MSAPGRLWLDGLERMPSPNADERPRGDEIDLLVIHNISLPPGEFGGTAIGDLFLNRLDAQAHPYFAQIATLRVSAHVLIRRDGGMIQFVALDRRAWHAGQSVFRGRERCNDFAVGIELEGTDEQPYDARQYDALARISATIRRLFPKITDDRIVGHSDIAPGRKTDPGPAFDWQRFRTLLAAAEADRPPGHGLT